MKGTASNNNTITNCKTDNNNDAGLQITAGAHNNLVQGSFSFYNYDIGTKGSNADGFACKLAAGAGNKFISCNSYNNSDDGWDLIGTDEAVTITGCASYDNKAAGFAQNNSAASLSLTNCKAYQNGANNTLNANQKTIKANFNFPYNPGNGHVFTFTDCTTTGNCNIYSGAIVIRGNVTATSANNPLPTVPGINNQFIKR